LDESQSAAHPNLSTVNKLKRKAPDDVDPSSGKRAISNPKSKKKARGQIDPPGGLDQPINAPAQSAAPSQPVAGSSQLVSNPSQPVSVPSRPVFGTILSKPVEPITIQLQRPATNAVNINHLINTRRVFIPPTVKQTTDSTPQDEGLTERVPEDTTPQDPKCSVRQTTPCWPRRIRLISPLVSPLGSPNKPPLITFKCDWLEKIAEPGEFFLLKSYMMILLKIYDVLF
jgi:hypothetical protein